MLGSQRGVEVAVKGPSQTAQEVGLRSVWVEGQEGNREEGQEGESRAMRRKESRRGEGGK